MADITATIQAIITGTYTRPRGLGEVKYTFDDDSLYEFTPGHGPMLLNVGYRTSPGGLAIPALGTVNLDMKGPLFDALGDPLVPDVLRVFWLYAYAANTGYVKVGGAAANAWLAWFDAVTDKERVYPNGMILKVEPGAGWAVTAGTGDILKLENTGTTEARVDLIALGSKAA